MTDVGTRIPLPSRSLVRPPVDERVSPRAPNPSLGAAGADETETDAPQRITVVSFLVDTERDSSYGDAVQSQGNAARVVTPVTGPALHSETLPESRLSRWQAQR